MQCEEGKTKPASTRKLLIQQVEEQSALCDVTVKMGHWEKKFHRCVLVASPFFDYVLKDDFLEKQTGEIEMTAGTPISVEMAIMFLYGKKPKLRHENIEHMIGLAEFLLIPNLKSACISWLKTVNITEENCMNLLQLSSIYDFEMPRCEEYLKSHMTEILRHAQMVNLSKESVQHLFTDKKLSYVCMDDKLSFLIRWTNSQPASRKHFLREMLQMIDFQEVSQAVLDEFKAKQNVVEEIDLETIVPNVEMEIHNSHRVLIMKGSDNDGTFWCLDLEREKWFRLKPETNQEERTYYYSEISGARNVNSEIYFTQRNNQTSNVLILNLDEEVCKAHQLVQEDNGDVLRGIDGVCIMGNTCIAYVNETLKIDVQKSLRLMTLYGQDSKHKELILDMLEGESTITRTSAYMDTSTLYIGYIKDECIMMSPLLTFKDDKISKICINKMFTVAVIFESRKVVSLLDIVDYKLETIQLNTEYTDKLVQTDDGFIIYSNERCVCLTRIHDPTLSSKFLTKEVSMQIQNFYDHKYFFSGNTWYRYFYETDQQQFMFESASYSDTVSQSSFEDVVWKKLPLPTEDTKCHITTIKENSFEICLPKHKLRCDIECPHCKLKPHGQTQIPYSVGSDLDDSSSYDSSYDYLYTDSSDEYYHGPMYSDDDYGYYLDSD